MVRILLIICLSFSGLIYTQNQRDIKKIDSLNMISYDQKILTSSSNLKLYVENLEQAEKINYQKGIADSYSSIAMIYFYQGKLDLSSNFFFKAINKYEEIGLIEQAASLYALYGYGLKNRDWEKSVSFMQKGIKIAEKQKMNFALMGMYDNYGVVKEVGKEYDSAYHYYNKALDMKLKANDKVGIPYSLNKIGMLNLLLKNYELSKENLDKAYKIRLELNDKIGIAENLNFYGIYYDSLGNHKESISYFERAITASKEAGYANLTQRNYKSLSDILERNQDYKNALRYFKQHSAYNDSINNLMVLTNRNELEVTFETEKKEREILLQKVEIAEKNLKIERKNLQIFGSIFLLITAIILGYFIYKNQKQKNIQLKKENELKDALALIETQNQLQNQRLKISRDLHDNIGSQLTFIISSIDNLRYFLKNENPKIDNKLAEINGFTKNTIVELRDTIWAMNQDEIMFEDLKIRINNFMDKVDLLVSDIDFLFYIDEDLNQIKLNSIEAMNLYRVIQEGVNNAVKHSEANKIQVKIEKSNHSNYNFEIKITDNGNGFLMSDVELNNGILNMKKRIEDIKGQIFFDSELNKGTEIKIFF